MSDNIGKFVKWFISASCVIASFQLALLAQDANSIKPVLPLIFLFGLAYILSIKAYNEPKIIIGVSIGVLVVSKLIANNIYVDLPIFNSSETLTWVIWTFIIGIPAMFHVFKKYE